MDRIAVDKQNVVCPVIDVISDDTLEYHYNPDGKISVGGFDWNLQVVLVCRLLFAGMYRALHLNMTILDFPDCTSLFC